MSDIASSVVATAAPADGNEEMGEAFVCAFNEVRDELVTTLFFVLRNYQDAQDSAQDAFLKCWRSRATLAEVDNLRAWIFRVGINAAKDLQRNAWRRRSRPLTLDTAQTLREDVTAAAVAEREERENLHQALGHLRAEERAVFLLRQDGSLNYEQIADVLKCPVGTAKTLMRAAVHKLRRRLARDKRSR